MGELIIYILKSSICLAAFYLFYKLLLTKETFHRFNRVVLILIFILAALIPFAELSLRSDSAIADLTLNLDTLLALADNPGLNNAAGVQDSAAPLWVRGLIALYIGGFIITALFSVVSFLRMYILLKKRGSKRVTIDSNITLIIHNDQVPPFSWMKYIAISDKDYNENGREIIAHEKAHIKGVHSVDILIAELMKTVHWFNPAAWLLKQEIRNIHEFQADEAVIKNGIDAKQYQLLLIKKAVGDRLYTMANSFNHSKLKNRITMITKKKSNRRASLKALFVLPLTLFAVILFANEKVTTALEPVSNVKITDLIQKDTTKKVITKAVIVKQSDKQEAGKYKTMRVKITAKDTAVVEYEGDLKDTAFVNKLKRKGYTVVSDSDKSVKIIKDGKIETTNTIIYINGKDINVDSLKKHVKTKTITIKSTDGKDGNVEIVEGTKDNLLWVSAKSKDGAKPIIIVNGEVVKDAFDISNYAPESIGSINIIKGEAAIKKYGDKAKEGAIEITLKEGRKIDGKVIMLNKSGGKEAPLVVMDGKVMPDNFDLNTIKGETISSITVLKDKSAVEKYGERAKNGVIEVTLKK
ncbi:hypothetical protein MASR2M69_15710 [Bacteroidota bacterium]